MTIICSFSCGAASAVATKLTLHDHPDAKVVNCYVAEEHPDNQRFLKDCEQWFGKPIIQLRNEKYNASAYEVFRRHRFIKTRNGGSRCSPYLKRDMLKAYSQPNDAFVVGFTIEERDRFDRILDANNDREYFAPLIDEGLSHADCLHLVQDAGLVLPMMYRLGYSNANCIGCVKGGQGYWNKIRVDFPERFAEMAAIEQMIGPTGYMFRDRKTGERYPLTELDPNSGRHSTELPECSVFCELIKRQHL